MGEPAPPAGQARKRPDRNLVIERPYVVLSCAMSVDGCLDSPGPGRLVLSGGADLDRVDGERASSRVAGYCDPAVQSAVTR